MQMRIQKLDNSAGTRPDRVHSDRQPKDPVWIHSILEPEQAMLHNLLSTCFRTEYVLNSARRGFCIKPSWRRASRKSTRSSEPTIGLPHLVPGSVSVCETLSRSDESDQPAQGPNWMRFDAVCFWARNLANGRGLWACKVEMVLQTRVETS